MKHHLWISIIFLIPTSGCLGWGEDVEISSEIQEDPLRIVFESPTLDRSEDLGATVNLDEKLRTSPVLLMWVSPHCGGCHNWTQNIIDQGFMHHGHTGHFDQVEDLDSLMDKLDFLSGSEQPTA